MKKRDRLLMENVINQVIPLLDKLLQEYYKM